MIYKRGFLGGGGGVGYNSSRSQDHSIKISRLFYQDLKTILPQDYLKIIHKNIIDRDYYNYSIVILFMYLLSGRHVFRKASKTGLFTRDKFSETS